MAITKKPEAPADKVELYDRVIATDSRIERKGAGTPYTSHNGHMFSYLHASGAMALKLPPGERERFLEKYGTKLFEAYGLVQKEFVTIPDELLRDTEELVPYLRLSYEYVSSLKPKASKKRG